MKTLRITALALLLAAAMPLAAQEVAPFVGVPATADQETAAEAWLRANAVPLPATSPTASDLAPIVARLSGARIIGIGEATHGTHEDQAFKADLIRALVESGDVRLLLMEGNIAPNAALDAYVRRGQGDPAAALRHPSQFRNVKGDEFAGLLLWLRAWNLAHPDDMVAIAGFDLQDGGRDADLALGYITMHDRAFAERLAPAFAALRPQSRLDFPRFAQALDAMSPAERAALLAAADELLGWFTTRAAGAGEDEYFASAHDAALAARQGVFVFEHGVSPPEGIDPIAYYTRRDRLMAHNALRLQERAGAGAVIWAHDMHVLDRFAPGIAAMGVLTLGTLIEERLGEDYRTVGFLWSEGTLRTTAAAPGVPMNQIVPDDRDMPLRADGPGTIGRLFSAALPDASAAWIDMDAIRADPALAQFRAVSYVPPYAGWYVMPDAWLTDFQNMAYPWTDAFDVMVWHRRVTPQRRWPGIAMPPAPSAPVAAP